MLRFAGFLDMYGLVEMNMQKPLLPPDLQRGPGPLYGISKRLATQVISICDQKEHEKW